MLVLSRKKGESIVIGGGITVTVINTKGNVVRIGIEAPMDVPILRREISGRIRGFELPELAAL